MRVLVIGLDGASPILINKWIDELPTFKMIREIGMWGLSIPPVPAQTPVAWTSFMTGQNPGKHGVFSFLFRKPGTYQREVVRPHTVRSKTLWGILSEHKKTVGVLNVPMSRLEKVNGFIVPGFLSQNEGIPHPPEIQRKISSRFGGMEHITGDVETAVLNKVRDDPEFFFHRVEAITDELSDVSLYLLGEERWDFFMVVFMGIDRLQHYFWQHVAQGSPARSVYGARIKQFYLKLDGIIHRFIKAASEDTSLILLSDHGFCSIRKEVLLNSFFRDRELSKVTGGKVDVVRSRAISHGYGDIWLNVVGREPEGIIRPGREYEETRDAIIQSLKTMKIDDEHPIKTVKKREEIYWGPRVSEAPDLMAIFTPGWQAARSLDLEASANTVKGYVNMAPRWSGGHDGAHDPEDVPGFLAIIGPGIKNQTIRANLWDFAPTILSLFGLRVPKEMDGKPIIK